MPHWGRNPVAGYSVSPSLSEAVMDLFRILPAANFGVGDTVLAGLGSCEPFAQIDTRRIFTA